MNSNIFLAFYEGVKTVYKYENIGLRNFLRGIELAVIRTAFGFGLYTFLIEETNHFIMHKLTLDINKYYLYTFSAVISKMTAITITCPLIVLKTRFELISYKREKSLAQEVKKMMNNNNPN
jgi:hypothetical protein